MPFYEAAKESINHMHEFMPWCHSGYSLEESKEWIESQGKYWANGQEYSFAIYDCKTKELLGGVDLNQINLEHQIGNLGYWVRKKALNMGVATRASLLAASYGFNELGLTRIEIVTLPNNTASNKVAEKTGAKYEGILQNRLVVFGEPKDACMYSLVK